jgi:hypothetical protein
MNIRWRILLSLLCIGFCTIIGVATKQWCLPLTAMIISVAVVLVLED